MLFQVDAEIAPNLNRHKVFIYLLPPKRIRRIRIKGRSFPSPFPLIRSGDMDVKKECLDCWPHIKLEKITLESGEIIYTKDGVRLPYTLTGGHTRL